MSHYGINKRKTFQTIRGSDQVKSRARERSRDLTKAQNQLNNSKYSDKLKSRGMEYARSKILFYKKVETGLAFDSKRRV